MSNISVRGAIVELTEQTLRELTAAVEKVKSEVEFTNEPMPDGDMSEEQYCREEIRRGKILISSKYSKIDFIVDLEMQQDTQESLGYSPYQVA